MKLHLYLSFILTYISSVLSGSVDYRAFDIDSTPRDLIWCGNNRDNILLLTENSSLYRSEDKGFTWKKLNDILINKGQEQLEPDDEQIGKVSEILLSPVDKNLVIILGTHGINWVSENCGRSISALNHGRKIHEFIFHPTERTWVLASAYTLCEDFQNEPCRKYKEIFVTKDLGNSWDLLIGYVVQFSWGVASKEHIEAGVPKERIIITYDPKGKGNQTNAGWNYKIDMIYSDDFFKTKKIAVQKGNKFLITKDFFFVAQVVDQEQQEVMLLNADPKSPKHYFFNPIEFTSHHAGKFLEHSYTFLDTTESAVFLHVNHFGESSRYGHVYISDSKGMKYSLSLANNIRSHDNQCDFEKIEGLEGIYIANAIDKDFIKDSEEEIQREALEEEGKMDESNHKSGKKAEDLAKDFVTTLITFNKGGAWERIKPPQRDLEGKLYDCEDECYLNLHGVSGDYPPFYSVSSAVGVVLANGNVGKFLSHNPEEISTFLSRDGGLSWFEVRKGSHTYEIGDHGGLIVIADDQHPTDTILYSWDEGLQWQELRVSDSKFMVKNIIIEPSSISQNFVIYGETTSKKGKKKGIVIGLNFSSLNERRCTGSDIPDSPESDYEKWSPSDSIEVHNCLMGRKTIYVRRKRESECYNGLDFERSSIVNNCDCTDRDYECDEGFYRPNIGEGCTPLSENTSAKLPIEGEIHKAPENCNQYFSISKGYRKIPGNSCVNGVKYDPIIVPCPSYFFSNLGVIFFVLLVLAGVGYVVYSFSGSSSSDMPSYTPKNQTGGYQIPTSDVSN